MQVLNSFKKEVLDVKKTSFEDLVLRIFRYQSENNRVYKKYLNLLNKNYTQINSIEKIPFLPIEFFKSHDVSTGKWSPKTTFLSSGTMDTARSIHRIEDLSFYHTISEYLFEEKYSKIEETAFLALLPSYIEQGNSSLVEMVKNFISKSKFNLSDFYLNDYEKIIQAVNLLKKKNIPTVLFGVTYALLDLSEHYNVDFSGVTVIETGGMKGRRKEQSKEEVHEILCNGLGVKQIHSEYGMTELLSQAYSSKNGHFEQSDILKILIRDINDPFSYLKNEKPGGVNIIDLANIHSCCFIETKDIGVRFNDETFKILGRFDNSDLRGCNLLVN